MKTAAPPRRETLNLRISAGERKLIDRAASLSGKTRTAFILEAARRAAEETLLDRAIFSVGPEAYARVPGASGRTNMAGRALAAHQFWIGQRLGPVPRFACQNARTTTLPGATR
jgi:uncharacterized protein (DUF1778 family)